LVAVGDGEFVGLWGADVAVVEGFGDTGDLGCGGGEPTDSGGLGIGVVAGGSEVGLQRAVPVVEVRPAPVDLAGGDRQLGLDPAALELQGADAVVEVGVAALHQLLHELLDRHFQHAAIMRMGV
jgi:hypothetical protein